MITRTRQNSMRYHLRPFSKGTSRSRKRGRRMVAEGPSASPVPPPEAEAPAPPIVPPPPEAEAPVVPPVPRPLRPVRRKRYLLLVDAAGLFRSKVKAALEETDVVLLEAGDGALAYSMAYKYRPDVIVIDVNLPGIDALELTRMLRKVTASKDTPIIALSGEVQRDDVLHAICAGVEDYLLKSFHNDQFLRRIRARLAA